MLRSLRIAPRIFGRFTARALAETAGEVAAEVPKVGAFKSLLNCYNAQLAARPIFTKCCTSFVLFGMGDIAAQLIAREKKFDTLRLLRGCVYGFAFFGPFGHYHYNFLEKLATRFAVRPALAPFFKMIVEQWTYFAVAVSVAYQFNMAMMETFSLKIAKQRVKENTWPTLKANWCFWPLVQIINFKFIPVAQQLNYVLFASLFWTTFLSWRFQGKPKEEEEVKKEEEE